MAFSSGNGPFVSPVAGFNMSVGDFFRDGPLVSPGRGFRYFGMRFKSEM